MARLVWRFLRGGLRLVSRLLPHVTPLLLLALLVFKRMAAPAPLVDYVRGSMLAPVLLLVLLLLVFREMRGAVWRAFVAASVTLLSLALVNQLVVWLVAIAILPDALPAALDGALLLIFLLAGNLIASRITRSLGPLLPATAAFLHATLSATLLALLLKLESYPMADPFADDARISTLWVPLVYGVVLVVAALALSLRQSPAAARGVVGADPADHSNRST